MGRPARPRRAPKVAWSGFALSQATSSGSERPGHFPLKLVHWLLTHHDEAGNVGGRLPFASDNSIRVVQVIGSYLKTIRETTKPGRRGHSDQPQDNLRR